MMPLTDEHLGELKIETEQSVKNIHRTVNYQTPESRAEQGLLPSFLHISVPETEYTKWTQLERCLDSLSKWTVSHHYYLNNA